MPLNQTVLFVVAAMPSAGDFWKLDGVNYAEWAVMMEAWLVKKGVWEIVNGEETKPLGSPNLKPVKVFLKHQAKVHTEIILHVEKLQLAYIRDTDPKATWDTLRATYRAHGFVMHCVLCWKFFGLAKQEDQSMPAWIAEVWNAVFWLQEIDIEVPDEDVIMVLTGGLPTQYKNFVTTLD
jgi:hypothetical protein